MARKPPATLVSFARQCGGERESGVDPVLQRMIILQAIGGHHDSAFHRSAGRKIEDARVWLGEGFFGGGWIEADDELLLVHTAAHVAVEQKR